MPHILPPGVVTPSCTQKSRTFSLFPLLGFCLPLLLPATLHATSTLLQPKVFAAIDYFSITSPTLSTLPLSRCEPCKLTFIQVVFQPLLILRLSCFSPSVTGNRSLSSQSLPFHSSYATGSRFSKYQLHMEDKGRVNPKALAIGIKCRLYSSHLTRRKIHHSGRRSDCVQGWSELWATASENTRMDINNVQFRQFFNIRGSISSESD